MNAPISTIFPHAQRRELKQPPIELIVAQVRFPLIVELLEIQGVKSFAQAMKPMYPIVNFKDEPSFILSSHGVSSEKPVRVWRFEDAERAWTLVLAPEFVALETKRYQTFPDFRNRFVDAVEELRRVHRPEIRTRLGLRYIDRISNSKQQALPDNWLSLVNSDVFALRSVGIDLPQQGRVERRFALQDMSLTFRTFFVQNGFGGQDDAEFVLDLDCYDPGRSSFDDLSHRLDKFKEVTDNAFWWSLGKLIDEWEPPS